MHACCNSCTCCPAHRHCLPTPARQIWPLTGCRSLSLLGAAPDFNVTSVDVLFAKDNLVAAQFTLQGTHTTGQHAGE